MGEFLKPAGQWLANNIPLSVGIGLFILSIFFKVPKKEINILGWVINKLGNAFFGGVRKDIKDLKDDNSAKFNQLQKDTEERIHALEEETKASFAEIKLTYDFNCKTMQTRLNDIEKKQDIQTSDRIRAHVLNFADDLRNGKQKTKEEYENIIEEDSKYETIVNKYELKNNVYTHAIKYIHEKYDESIRLNNFATY